MLMRERHPSLDLADAAGFMLIETLVAIISATVVTGALFMILIVSLHQTSRITGRVQATELGRDTMTHIVDELHSACIAKEFVPIQ
jgi:Tfp pilus assembly protein PilV